MADNITLPGNGSLVATDEITRSAILQHAQLFKIILGTENNYSGMLDFGQQVMTASLPVVIASNQSVIPISDNSGSLTVDAVDLDIRNLTSTDVVTVTGGAGQTADVKITLDGEVVVLGAGAASIGILGANSGVDIGDVTINNASGTSAVNIQDGGNSITIDGSVSISGAVDTELPAAATLTDNFANPTTPAIGAFSMVWDGATWDRQLGDQTDGTLVNLGSNNDVTITSQVPGTGATNLGKAIDSVAGTTDTGVAMLAVEDASLSATATADGDYAPLRTTARGALWSSLDEATIITDAQAVDGSPAGTVGFHILGTDGTNAQIFKTDSNGELQVDVLTLPAITGTVTANAGSGTFVNSDTATQVDDAPFTPATSRILMIGAEFDDTTPDSVNEGDGGAIRMSANRNLYSTIRDAAGNERGVNVTAGNALVVDGSAVTQPISGTVSVTEPVSVDDNAGSLTIDAPVGTPVNVRIGDGTDTATVTAGGRLQVEATGSGTFTVTDDGAFDVVNISGTVSLPTGAATSANQSTEITALQLIDDVVHSGDAVVSKYALIGAVLDDTSPATVTENQAQSLRMSTRRALLIEGVASGTAVNTSAAQSGIWNINNVSGTVSLPTGAATSANQSTEITALQLLDDVVATDGSAALTKLYQVGGTDGTNAQILKTDTAGELQVDVLTSALPTGAASLTEQQTQTASLSVLDDWDNAASDGASISGDIAHDTADAGEPVKIGYKAIAHGANPTAVAANDRSDSYSNRHGIPWVLGGHPNIVTVRANYTAAQTDTAIVTIAGGLKIVVTRCSVTAHNANSVNTTVVIGFGAVNTPTTTGVILAHPGIAAGSGVVEGSGSGMLGVGADGEDLRITSSVPTGGSIDVVTSYFTIES